MPREVINNVINNFPRSFAFRLTEEDGHRLDAVAAAAGTTPGEWARQTISAALGVAYVKRSMRRRVANAELLRELLTEISRQGNNLNQIAARLNAEQNLNAVAVRATIEAIRAGQASVVAAILKTLHATDQP